MKIEDIVGRKIEVVKYKSESFFGSETKSLIIKVDGDKYELLPRKLSCSGDVTILDIKPIGG